MKKIATLLRIDTHPVFKPRAKYCPSFVQAQQLIRAPDLFFWSDFGSATENMNSVRPQLTKLWVTGLYAMHWIASLCL